MRVPRVVILKPSWILGFLTLSKFHFQTLRAVGRIRVKTSHVDQILKRQGGSGRHRLGFHVGWVVLESLKFAGGFGRPFQHHLMLITYFIDTSF
jgi:hypothetical protein